MARDGPPGKPLLIPRKIVVRELSLLITQETLHIESAPAQTHKYFTQETPLLIPSEICSQGTLFLIPCEICKFVVRERPF
jgi:hypothetical protein